MEYDGVLPWTSETLGKLLFTQEIIVDMEHALVIRISMSTIIIK